MDVTEARERVETVAKELDAAKAVLEAAKAAARATLELHPVIQEMVSRGATLQRDVYTDVVRSHGGDGITVSMSRLDREPEVCVFDFVPTRTAVEGLRALAFAIAAALDAEVPR